MTNAVFLQSWEGVKKLIGRTGKDALKRRIWERDLEAIPLQDAQTADALIVGFQKEDIEIISKAASVFYSWVRHSFDLLCCVGCFIDNS